MKKNTESKNKKVALTDFVQKTVGVGKKVALSTKENVANVIEKAKCAALMKKTQKIEPCISAAV